MFVHVFVFDSYSSFLMLFLGEFQTIMDKKKLIKLAQSFKNNMDKETLIKLAQPAATALLAFSVLTLPFPIDIPYST